MPETIGLAEYIAKVKQDLLNKAFIDRNEAPLFAIEEVEIELSVVATKEGSGGGKAGFKLGVPLVGETGVELGGEGKYSKEDTQTVRVKLASLFTKEEILAKMSSGERAQAEAAAVKYHVRGGGDEVTGSDRA